MKEESISNSGAMVACTFMTIFYVAVLYVPTALLALPPPTSVEQFTFRRFLCAAVSTVVCFILSFLVLPVRWRDVPYSLGAYGIRRDHLWQAVVFPLFLTNLIYCGSLVCKTLFLLKSWKEYNARGGSISFHFSRISFGMILGNLYSAASDIQAWRNYVVAPLTEELVFRACMIPLLLCGGFKVYSVVFLTPVFFSLAHLNHLLELFGQKDCNLLKAFMIVGLQLGYTALFGMYATFLFIRTGHVAAPLVAHIFCNIMGLPSMFSHRSGVIMGAAFIGGVISFLWFLFPLTSPHLYNHTPTHGDCNHCWNAYCALDN